MSLDLSTLSTREALTAVYIGYYDRAADAAGMQFWEAVVANTSLDLTAITTDFASQSETQSVHPFFADPDTASASTFITSLYQNLFNRDPDADGLAFWTAALEAAVAGEEGAISVGEIIIAIIQGAVDVEGGTQDRTTILNKIEVGVAWTDAAEASGNDYDASQEASAKSIIEGITDDEATVTAAKSEIDDFFEPAPVPGEEYLLTSGTDVMSGTDNADEFNAYIAQNPFAGGVSNTLSSADRLDGGAGDDRLYAELSFEFLGVNQIGVTDIQPRVANIEEIDIEARDTSENIDNYQPFDPSDDFSDDDLPIIVDAKNITDHEEIGSYYSDGDLVIENLTTLTSGGSLRNTSDITITMDHTDNFNSDDDASDLIVYFDNDYLLSGQTSEGQVFYHLLDEDAELAGLTDRLDNIDVDGIRFNITNADGTVTAVTLNDPDAQTAGTHQGFVNALQDALQALIADGTLPAGTTLTLDPTNVDTTFLDDGSQSDDIPAIVLITGDGSAVEATGFSRVADAIGEYDVYGRFGEINETADEPITVNVDLEKVGRGGEGGDLIIGGKADAGGSGGLSEGIAGGIEVFRIDVLGDSSKPSNLGTVTSTQDALREVYISTADEFVAGGDYASLEIRDGFNETDDSEESGDLQLVNADAFLGNLYLGTDEEIINLDTLTAQGGGDVTFFAELDGEEVEQAYSYTTGSGDDTIDIDVSGDALDYYLSSLNVSTGGGDDSVTIDLNQQENGEDDDTHLNQVILDDVTVNTGDGDDTVNLEGVGNAYIMTGTGNDVIYSDGNDGDEAAWALNFDAERVDASGSDIDSFDEDDFPGEQVSLAYIGGATITVTLSGPGVADLDGGGGVMATDSNGTDDTADGATAGNDGYESSVTIGSLINGNQYYGDQRDINAAIIDAINNDPILSNLLVADVAANNTLIIDALVDGEFEDVDLRITIDQRDATTDSYANGVLNEAQNLFSDSSLTLTDLWGTTTFSTTSPAAYEAGAPAGEAGDLSTSDLTDEWYDGLSSVNDDLNAMSDAVGEGESNLYDEGDYSDEEVDTVINAGDGDDLIVLNTNYDDDLPDSFTLDTNNALLNGASNETVMMTGDNFGDDTVMNFTTLGAVDVTVTPDDSDVGFSGFGTDHEGFDFLDFTSYLTSQYDSSTGGTDSADSNILIPVTLDYNEDDTLGGTGDGAASSGDLEANEVGVVRFTADTADGETFAGLTASIVEQLFNATLSDTDDAFGDLDEADFDVAVYQKTDTEELIGDAKAIFMVENGANLGEYKVFELTWDGDDTDTPDSESVSAVALGSLDFGDSLTNLDDVNLVGSEDYAALLTTGFVA